MSEPNVGRKDADSARLPVEVEIYINSDGSVTFADLASEVVEIASKLNPDDGVVCDVNQRNLVDRS